MIWKKKFNNKLKTMNNFWPNITILKAINKFQKLSPHYQKIKMSKMVDNNKMKNQGIWDLSLNNKL